MVFQQKVYSTFSQYWTSTSNLVLDEYREQLEILEVPAPPALPALATSADRAELQELIRHCPNRGGYSGKGNTQLWISFRVIPVYLFILGIVLVWLRIKIRALHGNILYFGGNVLWFIPDVPILAIPEYFGLVRNFPGQNTPHAKIRPETLTNVLNVQE